MNKNQVTGLLIAIVTFFGPFMYAFMGESQIENIGLKLIAMVFTMAGAIAAIVISTKETSGSTQH